jgi:hypothetical protein
MPFLWPWTLWWNSKSAGSKKESYTEKATGYSGRWRLWGPEVPAVRIHSNQKRSEIVASTGHGRQRSSRPEVMEVSGHGGLVMLGWCHGDQRLYWSKVRQAIVQNDRRSWRLKAVRAREVTSTGGYVDRPLVSARIQVQSSWSLGAQYLPNWLKFLCKYFSRFPHKETDSWDYLQIRTTWTGTSHKYKWMEEPPMDWNIF